MRTEKLSILALGFCGITATALVGCGDQGSGTKAPATASEASSGEVSLDLALANGTTLNSATFTIVGPNAYSKTGSIDLTSATKLSTTIGGIPVGTGYTITINGTTTDSSTTCNGSATFNVTARTTTPVNVGLTCKEAPRTGSILVSGALNVCPVIDTLSANPSEVTVGGSIGLAAAAHDSDAAPSALTYTWAASAGTLSSTSAQNPTFTCGSTPGTATVTLSVSDGDPAASCADTQTVQITCSAAPKAPGTYVAGDFHNHTTCSDGSISMQKLVSKATDKGDGTFGLDWFVQAGHGGNGNRNCTLVEDATLSTPAYPFVTGKGPTTTWENSGVTPKGDASGTSPNKNMWRWQSIQEFQYPLIEYLNAYKNKPLFLGIESVVAGHEHSSMSVITGQIPAALASAILPTTAGYTAVGSGSDLAKWEYCFDRGDTDTSRGVSNNWDCSVPGSANAADPSWNATAAKLIPAGGTGTGTKGHAKTIEALKWMAANAPNGSYYVPAHLERAGQFNPDGNNGYNVEHLRNFNNAAPRVAFGMETQPGHGASSNRGEYQVLRNNIGGVQTDSVGGTTYGGTGVYGGYMGGVWDAMLGEGRNFWFFASSDWHNRGNFGPDDRRTTQDFYPGEYQRNYTMVRAGGNKPTPQQIVDGLRTGNNFASSGQIIDRLGFVACTGKSEALVGQVALNAAVNNNAPSAAGCATMGEKLVVASGTDIVIGVTVRDPAGSNFSPYTFANPSLAQVNINQPINQPVLDHVDVIGGLVTGYRTPGAANYSGEWPRNTNWLKADGTTADLSVVPDAAKNVSAAILKTFNGSGASAWTASTSPVDGSKFLTMTFRVSAVTASQYFRLRGTNMPAAVPFETDASGNPLADVVTNANDTTRLRIPCTTAHSASSQFDGCPDHLATATGGAANPINGQKAVSFDVAAWSDLWFYANPVYIEVTGSTPVAGVN
ncbi:MAG TPA: hypothetical protein VER96_22880 [Polyangiaceae bacterium]|nr:hypothetical protein [Polyangiaceae bacterium]